MRCTVLPGVGDTVLRASWQRAVALQRSVVNAAALSAVLLADGGSASVTRLPAERAGCVSTDLNHIANLMCTDAWMCVWLRRRHCQHRYLLSYDHSLAKANTHHEYAALFVHSDGTCIGRHCLLIWWDIDRLQALYCARTGKWFQRRPPFASSVVSMSTSLSLSVCLGSQNDTYTKRCGSSRVVAVYNPTIT